MRNEQDPNTAHSWRTTQRETTAPTSIKPEFELEIRENKNGEKVLWFPFMSISDVHLGTRHSRAKRLAHMLEHTESDDLKAVGDIVDFEYMRCKSSWNFAPWHRQVVGHMLRKNVHYFPGNHDEASRGVFVERGNLMLPRHHLAGKTLAGIRITNEDLYIDPKGRRIKIKHGDDFDDVAFGKNKAMWYQIGDTLHSPIAHIDTFIQEIPGLESFSIAAFAKKQSKTIINDWLGVQKEIVRSVEADPSIDGLLYGHSHMGGIKHTPHGKLILNDGCTTEHVQAMVHDRKGNFALITWHKNRLDIEEENGARRTLYWNDMGLHGFNAAPKPIEDAHTHTADRLIRVFYRVAPPKDRQRAIKARQKAMRKGLVPPPLPKSIRLPLRPVRLPETIAYRSVKPAQ